MYLFSHGWEPEYNFTFSSWARDWLILDAALAQVERMYGVVVRPGVGGTDPSETPWHPPEEKV